jgi:hypothetical protein
MKIKIGMHSDTLEMFDNEENRIHMWVKELDISLRPGQATKVSMVVDVDEVEVEVDERDILTTRRKPRVKILPLD